MGIYLDSYRENIKNILEDIKILKIESDYLTPWEVLRINNIQNTVEDLLQTFDSNKKYLKNI